MQAPLVTLTLRQKIEAVLFLGKGSLGLGKRHGIPHLTGCSQIASRDLESLGTVHALAHDDAALDVAYTPVVCVLYM